MCIRDSIYIYHISQERFKERARKTIQAASEIQMQPMGQYAPAYFGGPPLHYPVPQGGYPSMGQPFPPPNPYQGQIQAGLGYGHLPVTNNYGNNNNNYPMGGPNIHPPVGQNNDAAASETTVRSPHIIAGVNPQPAAAASESVPRNARDQNKYQVLNEEEQ
eukprot:TRINITY_DN2638_c0_g1_i2.p2 TRINITY_DN2638_c0_g1~~TRINITY_DN2638_c0_g1_i2.p2  ORF type:complete len:161 (-),score=32.77 TRINITY_DN2638_c0_g1_i2:119-601(-)